MGTVGSPGLSMLTGIAGQVPTKRLSVGYRVAVVLLAGGLLFLAVTYGLLLAFLAWLVAWHLIQTVTTFSYGPYFLYHVPMAVLGGLLLTFLTKPLFRRDGDDITSTLMLHRSKEPALFEFVDRLCELTGARKPAMIEVDAEANAAVRSRGILGLLKGEMVLRIGLPLVAALSLRQFTGVLAHELGHFQQRKGIVSSHLIRRLNGFFARIVFERDALDVMLLKVRGENNDAFRNLVFFILWLPVEAARGVLWILLVAADLLSCWAMRQMEHDADLVEAGLVGVEEFATTSRLILTLGLARESSRGDLFRMYQERRLPDDLPALIAQRASTVRSQHKDLIDKIESRKTVWHDTHPCHADRTAHVRQAGLKALLREGGAASELFADFPSLSRDVTRHAYRRILGKDFDSTKLVDTGSAVTEMTGEDAVLESLQTYMRRLHTWLRPVLPGSDAELPVEDLNAAGERLLELRQSLLAADAQPRLVISWIELQGRKAVAEAQRIATRALVGYADVSRAQLRLSNDEAEIREGAKTIEPELARFWARAEDRLTLGLRLAHTPGVLAEAETMELLDQAPLLLELCRSLQAHGKAIRGLRFGQAKLDILLSLCQKSQIPTPLHEAIMLATEQTRDSLSDLRTTLSHLAYPFAHGTTAATVGAELVPELPKEEDPVATYHAAELAAGRAEELITRAVARLAKFAAAAESAIGLPALDALPEITPDEASIKQEKEQDLLSRKQQRNYWLTYSARAAGGLVMLSVLVGLSVAPPTLPSFSSGGGASGYRPAAFNTHVRSYVAPPVVYTGRSQPNVPNFGPIQFGGSANPDLPRFDSFSNLQPRMQPGQPYVPVPGQPRMGQPFSPRQPGVVPGITPGITPGMTPGYRPPSAPRPGYQPQQPGPYRPQPGGGGGYRPPQAPMGGGGGGAPRGGRP